MTRRYRILVVAACPVPFPRGTPIRVTRLSEALAHLGHEVHLVTYATSAGTIDPAVHVHRIRSVPGIRVERPGPTFGKLAILDPLLAMRVRKLVRGSHFDLVHAHHYEGLLIAAAACPSNLPIVYDAHTVLETELPAYRNWLRFLPVRKMGGYLDRRLPALARFVVAVSEPLRDHLVAVGASSPDRIDVIGNGVELGHFLAPVPALGPGADDGVLVYAGNLAPYQGIDFLLQAFRTVLTQRPNARLHILTDSSFEPYEKLASALELRDRIDVRSVPVEALSAELAQAHVTVNPRPQCDGVPQKNLNYMGAATALVAFRDSLHPCRDGESGKAVNSVSGAALGSAILGLLANPEERTRLALAARVALERDFTWPRQAQRVSDLYGTLLTPSLD